MLSTFYGGWFHLGGGRDMDSHQPPEPPLGGLCWQLLPLHSKIHLGHFYMFLQVVLSVLPCKSMLQSMSIHPDLLYIGVFYIHLILVLCSPCEWLCPAPRLQSCGQQLTSGEVFVAPGLCIILWLCNPLQLFHVFTPLCCFLFQHIT